MRTINNTEAIFNSKLFEFRIDVSFATDASEGSGSSTTLRRARLKERGGLLSEGPGPAADRFIVKLGEGDFDCFKGFEVG